MLYQLWLVGQISYDNKVSFPRISDEGGAGCLETALSPEYSESDIWASSRGITGELERNAEPQPTPACLKSEPVL